MGLLRCMATLVRQSGLSLWILTLLMVVLSAILDTSHGQIHGRNGPFDRVTRLLQRQQEFKRGPSLDIKQTQLMIDTLLQRVDCYSSTNPEVCDWCIPAESLFRIVGIDVMDGYLSEATFGQASLVILYYIHAPEATCTLGPSTAGTNDSFSYRDYILALSGLNSSDSTPSLGSRIAFGEGAIFSKDKLELLLQSINKTYIPTSSFQCFEAHTLIEAASIPNDQDIAQSGMEILAAHLVSSLLHGHCIGEGLLVPPSYFSDYIFDEFGSNHIIREAGLQRLLSDLDLGNAHTDHASDGAVVHEHGGPTVDQGFARGHGHGTGHDQGHDQGNGHGQGVVPDHQKPTNRTTSNPPTQNPYVGFGMNNGHDHHGHPHRYGNLMKRSTSPDYDHRMRRRAPNHDSHPHHQEANDTFQQCYSGDQLLDIFGINEALGISERQFSELCPAILHQIITDACNPDKHAEVLPVAPLSTAEVYGYGTLSVFIITASSMIAVLILPCLGDRVQGYVIHAFVALSISTMSGDALMHLIPEALGLHTHGDAGNDGHGHHQLVDGDSHSLTFVEIDSMDVMFKMATVLGSIYFFFLFESLMTALFSRKTSEDAETRRCSRLVEDCDEKTSVFNHQAEQVWLTDTPDHGLPNLPEPSTLTPLSVNMNGNNDVEDRCFESLVQEQTDTESRSCLMKGLAPVSIMVLLGDALHNALDGLVIGAAFTSNIFVGVSTSIAVLCHEIPHELGDFGVLIENGMSYGRAVFWNFASGCSAFIGLYLGIIIGTREGAQQWLFAITAGFFLYISMVDLFGGMLRKDDQGHGHSHGSSSPSLKRSPAMSNRHSWLQEMALNEQSQKRSKFIIFLCQNIGLLSGWAIMFLLSYYEEELLHLNIFSR